jgi:hypothetical protein
MATENLTVQFAAVETASFDVKNRVLLLPTMVDLDALTLDLFVGHEIAHALWTPADGLENLSIKDRNFHSFINVVEDARIERLVQRKYPGLKKPFYQAYTALHEKDFFGTSKMDVSELLMIDRLNLKAKLGTQIGIEFEGAEKEFYNRAMNTETWEEVVKLAEDLYEYCQQEMEEKTADETADMTEYTIQVPSPEQSEEEQSEEEKIEVNMTGDNQTEQGQTSGADDAEEEDTEEDVKEMSSTPAAPIENLEGKAEDEDATGPGVRSITDRATQENTKQFVDTNEENIPVYMKIPKKVDVDKFIVPFDTIWTDCLKYWNATNNDRIQNTLMTNAKEFKKKNDKVINYLHKEFEMKKAAQSYARANTSKTGVINPDKLFSYKYNEDIFAKKMVIPNGKNHGIVFFIDWSGSMADNLRGTVEQLINLALFCKKSAIPFAAYAFTSEYDKRNFGQTVEDNQSKNLGEISLDHCMLLEFFNEKMNTTTFNRAISLLVAISQMFDRNGGGDFRYWGLPREYYLGGTPLNTTIVIATRLIENFKKRNNVQIINSVFLTDGSSHQLNGYYSYDKQGNPCVESYLRTRKVYIQDGHHTVSIDNPDKYRVETNDITKALYKLMKISTGANTCGFFLASPRDIRYVFGQFMKSTASTTWGQYQEQEDFKKKFNREKSVVSYDSGLDELYIMKGGKTLEINDEGLEVENGASKAKLTTAFKKMTKGKLQNRVILSKFIEKIAA